MPVKVVCPQCGAENRTAGVFCVKCGARMGAPSVQQQREAFPIGRVLSGVARLVVILVLAVVVVLLFWPLKLAETAVDEGRAQKFSTWVGGLERLIQSQGTTANVVGDADINNYLAWRILQTPEAQKPQGMQMGLERVRVEIQPSGVRAVALGGWGPMRLTFDVRGSPTTEGGRFRLAVQEARVGHLKMPRPAHGWVAEKLEQILGGMGRERTVLDHVRRVDLADGKARLVIGP